MNIEAKFPIYKLSNRVFQIGDLDYDQTFIVKFCSILDLGLKFIPSYFNSFNSFYNFLMSSIDNSLNSFNFYLFCKKMSKLNSNSNKDSINTPIVITDETNQSYDTVSDKIEFLKKFKKTSDYNNIPIQRETIDLRFKCLKILSENCFSNLNNNLTKDQFNCLRHFLKNKPFTIVNCDKNVGWAIIDTKLYDNLAREHLFQNENTYKKLEDDPLLLTIESINGELLQLNKSGHISNKLYNQLKIKKEAKSGNMSLMPKLH